jgi:hypothetical protein
MYPVCTVFHLTSRSSGRPFRAQVSVAGEQIRVSLRSGVSDAKAPPVECSITSKGVLMTNELLLANRRHRQAAGADRLRQPLSAEPFGASQLS